MTRRAVRRGPGLAVPLLFPLGVVLFIAGWLTSWAFGEALATLSDPLSLSGAALLVAGPLLYSSRLVWFSARVAGRRARSAETLLAARALEADARPWGRTVGVVAVAVAIGAGTGWIEAGVFAQRHRLEPFWLSSFVLVDLALLVGIAVAAAALLVRQAEYLLEHGPVLAALHATGASEGELRRVLVRQSLMASVVPCAVAALTGFLILAGPLPAADRAWLLWPLGRAIGMAGLGVLAAVLAARTSRRRLRRALLPTGLRTE